MESRWGRIAPGLEIECFGRVDDPYAAVQLDRIVVQPEEPCWTDDIAVGLLRGLEACMRFGRILDRGAAAQAHR